MTLPDHSGAGNPFASKGNRARGQGAQAKARDGGPQWADGLRRLYDAVVDEPLPDDLAALLARLDSDGQQGPR